jgi:hypothetical protein
MAMMDHDTDAFSGKLLKQFGKGKIGGDNSEQFGTMANFMKSDLRLQASTNQFVQKGFKLNKKSLSMAFKYYELDKKVRKEERDFYKKTKDVRKVKVKNDRLESIWRKEILKGLGATADNTDTLRRERRLQQVGTVTSLGQKGGRAISSGLFKTINALGTGRNAVRSRLNESNQAWAAQSRAQKAQKAVLMGIDKTVGGLIAVTKKLHQVQERGNARRNQRERDRDRIRESQGIGPRQTRQDARELKEREKQALREARQVGGAGSTDEEKEARRKLQQEAKELRALRRRGFTGDDISSAYDQGTSRSELVASGRHRRRSRQVAGRFGRMGMGAARGVGKGLGFAAKGLMKAGPALGMLATAGIAVNQLKSLDAGGLKDKATSFIKESPMLEGAREQFDAISSLLPKGVKDQVMKFGSKIFDMVWGKLSAKQGGQPSKITNLINALLRFLDIIGGAVKNFGSILFETILSGPVIETFTSTGKFLAELGKHVVGSLTGILNFLTDIFGESKKAFGPAFMEHIWPHLKDFSMKLLPSLFDMLGNIFIMLGKAVKGLIIGFVGRKTAALFGLRGEPTKMGAASEAIVAGQDQMRAARRELLMIDGGGAVIGVYAHEGLEAAMEYIKEKERKGDIKHSDAEKMRQALSKLEGGKGKLEAGKKLRKEAKEKIAKKSAKEAKTSAKSTSTAGSSSSNPQTSTTQLDPTSAVARPVIASFIKNTGIDFSGVPNSVKSAVMSVGAGNADKIFKLVGASVGPNSTSEQVVQAISDAKAQITSSAPSSTPSAKTPTASTTLASSSGAPVSTTATNPPSTATGGGSVVSNAVETGKSIISKGAGIAGAMSTMATDLMTQGVSGIASLPSGIMDKLSGTKAGVMAEAMSGALQAARHEMERVGMAMNNALTSDPNLAKMANSTTEMSGATHQIAHQEDKNRNAFTEKGTNPLEQIYNQQHGSVSV